MRCRLERRELDAVPVYFADVEVGADLGDVRRGDVVGGAPDALGGFVLGLSVCGCWLGKAREVGVERERERAHVVC